MEIPDKIYVFGPDCCNLTVDLPANIEYIRKETILSWLMESMNKEEEKIISTEKEREEDPNPNAWYYAASMIAMQHRKSLAEELITKISKL